VRDGSRAGYQAWRAYPRIALLANVLELDAEADGIDIVPMRVLSFTEVPDDLGALDLQLHLTGLRRAGFVRLGGDQLAAAMPGEGPFVRETEIGWTPRSILAVHLQHHDARDQSVGSILKAERSQTDVFPVDEAYFRQREELPEPASRPKRDQVFAPELRPDFGVDVRLTNYCDIAPGFGVPESYVVRAIVLWFAVAMIPEGVKGEIRVKKQIHLVVVGSYRRREEASG